MEQLSGAEVRSFSALDRLIYVARDPMGCGHSLLVALGVHHAMSHELRRDVVDAPGGTNMHY